MNQKIVFSNPYLNRYEKQKYEQSNERKKKIDQLQNHPGQN